MSDEARENPSQINEPKRAEELLLAVLGSEAAFLHPISEHRYLAVLLSES